MLVRLLGDTLLCSPIKLFGKLPVESGKIHSVSGFRSAALFDRPRTVVVGIVGHGVRTS